MLEILAAHHGMRGFQKQPITRYPHTDELDKILQALSLGRLYESGPGPPPLITATYERPDGTVFSGTQANYWDLRLDGWRVGAENTYLGTKAVHPFTGAPVLHRCGVCISVRFGKSMMCSLAQPAWYILQMTSTIVSVVGHTANFAERRLGGRMQRFLRKYSEVIGIPLKPGPVPMSEFEFLDESLLSFAGWEAGVLGEGRGQGILDDLLKSRELASSEKHREKIREFLSGDWPTRATPVRGLPPPSEVWVGSRIHAEDPHGMFVVEEDDPTKPKQGWYLIHRPALLTNPETGEERSACEAMVPLADIQNVRRMDPFVFQAQYQNDPRPVEGTGFPKAEAWPRYRVSSDYLVPLDGAYAGKELWPDDRFGTIDLAQSESKKADWTVVAVWDYHRESGFLFLRFVARERVNVLDHMKWIRDTVRPVQRDRPLKYAVVENSTLSAALLEFSGRKAGYFGFPIREVNRPHRGRGSGARVLSKNQRIALYAQASQAATIYIPEEDQEWFGEWINEHTLWPNAAHDDQLDCGADACFEIRRLPSTPAAGPAPRQQAGFVHSNDWAVKAWRRKKGLGSRSPWG